MHASRTLRVVVLCLAAAAVSAWGCKKKPADDADAAAEAGADLDAAADAAADAAPEAAADDAGTTPLAATATAVRTAGGPFEGSYRCFGGLTLKQNGNLVSAVIVNKLSTSVQTTQWNCTVVRPDHCEGTEVVTVKFNDPKTPPKAPASRKVSIEHRADGVSVKLERSIETILCKK
jgi:hypothetical protein